MNNRLLARLPIGALASACAAVLAPPSLMAQDGELEEIVVTGSFISRPADRPQPVSILDAAEIRANQRVTLAEVVRDMPQISTANVTSNWERPTNSINMRGLGSRSTLVLLNGQRMTIDANAGSQVDINNLAPSIMVERIEMLLDGASALYGSDAVAGVVNFITRDRFEGLEVNVSSQWAETQTDTPEVVTSAIFGTGDSDSHLVMAVEMQRRDNKLQEEDRFGPERLSHGLITALWNPGTYLAAPGAPRRGWHRDPLCSSPEIGGTPQTDDITDPAGFISGPFCRGLLSLQRTTVPERTELTGMAVFTQDFGAGPLSTMRVEASFARTESQSSYGTGVPLLALPSVSGQIPVLPRTNPGVLDAHVRSGGTFPLQDYGRIFSRQLSPLDGDETSLDSSNRQNTYRVAASLEGMFSDSWNWRLTGTFSQNDQRNNAMDTITDRYMRAVQGYGGPSCKWNYVQGATSDPTIQRGVGSCQYWNPFASRLIADPFDETPIDPSDPNSPPKRTLYNSPELLDWMMFGGQAINESRFTSFEFLTTGELWEMAGGTTGVALGVQVRNQELDIGVDTVRKDGGLGFRPQILRDWDSQRDTEAFFAELVMFPHEDLEIDIAARAEETLGLSSTEPKISMLWTPSDNLYFRATAGSSFRLPAETHLFGVGGGSVARDTIGGEVTQATGIGVGNPNLLPEESDNFTLGVTWDITDNFTVDLTWWDYEFTNLVATTDAEDTLRQDLLDGWVNAGANNSNPVPPDLSPHPLFPGRPNEYCEVTRNWRFIDENDDEQADIPLPEGCLTGFDFQIFRSSWQNQDIIITNGFDLTLDWRRDFGVHRVGARFIGSFVEEYSGIDGVNDDGATPEFRGRMAGTLRNVVGTDGDGVAGVSTNPDLRANLILTYGRGNHNVRGTFRYVSGITNTDPNPLEDAFDESAYTQLDVVYDWDVPMSRPATLSFTVLNITDEEPPLNPNGLITYNSGLYDGRGRMFRLMWNQGF